MTFQSLFFRCLIITLAFGCTIYFTGRTHQKKGVRMDISTYHYPEMLEIWDDQTENHDANTETGSQFEDKNSVVRMSKMFSNSKDEATKSDDDLKREQAKSFIGINMFGSVENEKYIFRSVLNPEKQFHGSSLSQNNDFKSIEKNRKKREAPGFENLPRQISESPSGQMLKSPSGQMSESPPGQIAESQPSQIYESTPGQISASPPGQISQSPPGQISESSSGQPDEKSESYPGQISENTPGQISASPPGQISESPPGQISESSSGQPGEKSESYPGQISESPPGQISASPPGQISESSLGQPDEKSESYPGQISESPPGQISETTAGQISASPPGQKSQSVPRAVSIFHRLANIMMGKERKVFDDPIFQGQSIVLPSHASCRDRCGQEFYAPCSCDITCFVYRTCCEDVIIACPALEREARLTIGDLLIDTTDHTQCDQYSSFSMVTRCPRMTTETIEIPKDDFVAAVRSMTIVSDNNTADSAIGILIVTLSVVSDLSIVFKNSRIYECYMNQSQSLRHWTVNFDVPVSMVANGITKIMSHLDPSKARFSPPLGVQTHECSSVHDTCSETLQYMDQLDLCGRFLSYSIEPMDSHKMYRRVYGNRFCYYCIMNKTDSIYDSSTTDGNKRGSGFRLLMDLTGANSFTLKSTAMALSWSQLSCIQNNVSRSSSKPQDQSDLPSSCAHSACTDFHELINGICMSWKNVYLYLRHPPTHQRMSDMLDLAKFVTCYLENIVWRKPEPPGTTKVKKVNLYPLDANTTIESYNHGNISGKELFLLALSIHASDSATPVDLVSSTLDAAIYFYINKNYVQRTDGGMFEFTEYAAKTRDEIVGVDDIDLVKDNLPILFMALATWYRNVYNLKEIAPITWKGRSGLNETCAKQCFISFKDNTMLYADSIAAYPTVAVITTSYLVIQILLC